ncbi:glyoxalase [Bordetella ansorpii]|uniref:Glyoxalase n=1 Tax=Bordetella ansorpii TaxID=288768 RepID=A0A157SU10_9BORD|nr:glyoxalase [Bordetella ansorpii]
MQRFHIHLHVADLDRSIAFYSRLFATQPTRIEADYAKWMLEGPQVNVAISTRDSQLGVDHFGIPADDDAELAVLKAQARAAHADILDKGQTTCCYVRSNKHWVTDPQVLRGSTSIR